MKLLIRDMKKTQLVDITTSSPFITAKQSGSDSNWIKIDVTLMPGLPSGALMESLVAHSNNDSFPEAKLKVTGSILGDVSITPEALMLYVAEPGKADDNSSRSMMITNYLSDIPLTSIVAHDPDDRLILEVKTVDEGMKYELVATVKDEFLNIPETLAGKIILTTDSPTSKELSAIYRIIVRRK